MKERIQPAQGPAAVGPYSAGIRCGDLIFVSGQLYVTKDGKLLDGSIEEQTDQVLRNVQSVLQAAGADLNDVVKATVYLTDMSHFLKFNSAYAKHFSEPCPARETVCVKELPLGARLEISVIAFKAEK